MKTKSRQFKIATGIILLGIMALIFGMSGQTGNESGRLSGIFVKALIQLFVGGYSAMAPDAQLKLFAAISFLIRKLAHFSEYMVLGFCMLLHLQAGKDMKKSVWLSMCLAWAYAAGDELHQGFVPGRAPQIRDVLIDCAGIIVGIALCYLILRRKMNENKK